ncbi:hypothetical protein FKP32DRAFT_1673456 [Trametes sanguinea]|nr:hypothetical protein FKP32DRAFT_1673456 [Trametes sanguinea]
MSIPHSTREYRLPKADGFHNLTLTTSPLPALKATDALIRVHAVSLQHRDLLVARGRYPLGQKPDLVPCSDMAGSVVALGPEVQGSVLSRSAD